MGSINKKIERRIKSGRDPKTSFDSALISADQINVVMERCYKGMTVYDVHDVIHAVKAPVDDMTPDELRIYKKIRPLIEKQGEQWAEDIYNDRATNPSLRDVIAPVLTEELTTTMQRRTAKISQTLGTPPLENDNTIIDWLSNHVPMVTKGIDQTSADVIQKVVGEFRTTPGMTIQDVQSRLSYAYDPNRAKMIAITETTRAASQATTSYQDYLRERGINMIRVWNTDADELVCPICAPLNGKTEKEWGAEFPDGAPAHVNCRCDTSLRLDRESKPTEDTPQTSEEQFLAPESVTVGQQPAPTAILERTASEIADEIIASIPESTKAEYDKLEQLRDELKTLYAQGNAATDLQTRLQLMREANLKIAEIKAQVVVYHKAEAASFDAVLPKLQSTNPQQVVLNFNPSFTERQRQEIQKYVELTVGMSKQRDDGTPITINVELNRSRGAYGQYDPSKQTLLLTKTGPTHTTVHETLHAMQHQLGYGVKESDAYGDSRTAGLTMGNNGGYNTYIGITDNDYAFRIYPKSTQRAVGKYCEILTNTFHNITTWSEMKDRGIIELVTQIIKDNN